MSALDVGARGLAARASAVAGRNDEAGTSLAQRTEPTARALETLSREHSLLTCEAGARYIVDASPYLTAQNLVIRGNGAELRNVNTTPLNIDEGITAALPLGVSNVFVTSRLAYYNVASASGPALTLQAGASAAFAPGDLVIVHGATRYDGPNAAYEVYRNYLRAKVVSVSGDNVTLDRGLSPELSADNPVVANTAEGVPANVPGADDYYLLHAPRISNLRIASDVGEAVRYGGVIDGVLRDMTLSGRNGLVLNAMQDCVVENVRFSAWRKICELAEGSNGTIVRGLRGTLGSNSGQYGGQDDVPPFFIAISESCTDCVFEDLHVSSGPNSTSGPGAAVLLGSGRNNRIRNSIIELPAHTGQALAVQCQVAAGHPAVDCGFEGVTVIAPSCSQFFVCNDGGAGIVRPFLKDSRFSGTPSACAATLAGTDGRLARNRFETGDVQFADNSATGWRIEGNTINGSMTIGGVKGNVICGNFIRDGFADIGSAQCRNNTIADNESEASRALNAAAVIADAQSANITATAANTPYRTMVCPAGSLAPGDRIAIRARLVAGGSGGGNRNAAVSVSTPGSGRLGCGARVTTAYGSLNVEGELVVQSDTSIIFRTSIGGVESGPSAVVVESLAANPLTVAIEAWVTGTEVVVPYGCRIIPIKLGMKHLPLL